MRKLSDYKNEEAIDLLADILDPVTEVFADKGFTEALKVNKLSAVKYVLKNHKKGVIQILARLEDTPVEEYECSVLTMPIALMQILNDKELIDFFKSQGLEIEETSSGSAMENIEEEQ